MTSSLFAPFGGVPPSRLRSAKRLQSSTTGELSEALRRTEWRIKMTETAVLEQDVTDSQRDELVRLLDEFLATATHRNLVPVGEVEDLALDLRNVLAPPVKADAALE